jgi:serine/threonine protein phosphatase PrpC
LTDLGPIDRCAAPEAVEGGIVAPAADVYLAAAHALALLTAGPVQVTCDDVPLVLGALALFRRDLTPRLIALLHRCLDRDPDARPATPRDAFRLLREAVSQDLRDRGRSRRLIVPFAARTEPGARPLSSTSAGPDELHEPRANQDRFLCRSGLRGGLVALAVLDGVSTTDIGTGEFAAESARQALEAALGDVWEDRWKPAGPEKTFDRLARASLDAINHAHCTLIGRVFEEFGDRLEAGARTPVTTCTLALIQGEFAVVTWTGDSPAYLVRRDRVAPLTAPTSAGNLAMRDGHSANAYLEHHAPRQVAWPLGAFKYINEYEYEAQDVPTLWQVGLRLEPGDFLLLASDGVGDYLAAAARDRDAFLRESAGAASDVAADPEGACRRLLDLVFRRAVESGSPDDMTLIVASVAWPPEPAGSNAVRRRDARHR